MEAGVRAAFKDVGDAEVNDVFVDTCVTLCKEYGVSEDDLATQWEALALNHPHLGSTGLLKKLKDTMAREQQRQEAKRRKVKVEHGTPVLNTRTVSKLPGHGRPVDKFASPIAISSNKKRTFGGGAPTAEQQQSLLLSSPIAGSAEFKSRTNMGKVELAWNETLKVEPLTATTSDEQLVQTRKTVKVLSSVEPYRYMYSTLNERAEELEQQLLQAKADYQRAYGWTEEEFCPVGTCGQTPVLMCGRICCEAPNGKLNPTSLVLEGSRADSNGARVKLDVTSSLTSYSLFAGQIVVVRGVCPSGHMLFAKELFTELRPPAASSPKDQLEKWAVTGGSAPTSIYVASGPFSTQGDLEYDPLEDLLAYVASDKPDVLVLMGPFVDVHHPMVASGRCQRMVGDTSISLTFQDLQDYVLSRVAAAVDGTRIQVVLVPSTHDATHHVCFPQPPFVLNTKRLGFSDPSQVILASNPSVVSVNDVVLGINTQDIVMDLAKDEVAKVDATQERKGRIVRLTDHLLNSASFYPLFPPTPEAQLELKQQDALKLPVKPDIVLLSSKLRHFAHESHGTLCVNPGKLTRGKTGGMYAKIWINPRRPEEISKLAEESDAFSTTSANDAAPPRSNSVPNAIPSRTRVEIVRV